MKHPRTPARKFSILTAVTAVLCLLLLFGLVSCTDDKPTTEPDTTTDTSETVPPDTTVEEPDVTTAEPATDPQEETTDDPTTEPEETTDTEPVETETEYFNQGIVEYDTILVTSTISPFDTSLLGTVISADDAGVVSVFGADFEDGDPNCGGDALSRNAGSTAVTDGKLHVPPVCGGWTTWSHVAGASVKEYAQVQLSVTGSLQSTSSDDRDASFWGCYVSNYAFNIPDSSQDGIWFSFNAVTHKVKVWNATVPCWASGGLATFEVDPALMTGDFTIDIVCTSDYTTYCYMTAEGSTEAVLICYVKVSDKLSIYDGTDTLVTESATVPNLAGDHFVLFSHGGSMSVIEDMSILVASTEAKEITEIQVTATPVGDNKLGLDITDKTDLVSILYSVWFDAILGMGTDEITGFNNITEVLAGNQSWGGDGQFHYWAKPALGYYRSSNETVIRTHMTQLYDAGVDFIIIDFTNAGDGYVNASEWVKYVQLPMEAILNTIMEMRAEGLGTPYVVFWSGDSAGPLYKEFYDKYYSVEKWQDCFVYWEDKPFMILTHNTEENFPYNDLFTVRSMWGLTGKDCWRFLNVDNSGTVYMKDGVPEQLSVAVATQETYMSLPTAHGRNHGIFFYTQWTEAFEVHPKIVTLTWWNEWAAQKFIINGEICFVDNYNQEYSRDIEPMAGGHGDQYYQWMKQYIAAYKNGEECPVLVEEGYEEQARQAAGTN